MLRSRRSREWNRSSLRASPEQFRQAALERHQSLRFVCQKQ
ncbi:UNVERIFIED_CONTAM: hypothetical protein GTU68_029683 [Idotea baltica]|nr:hypothetical protein [Idotea baltica]